MLGLTFSSKLDWGSYIISINLPYAHVWNTVVTSGLVPPVATWICYGYAELLVLHLLLLLNPWLVIEMWSA